MACIASVERISISWSVASFGKLLLRNDGLISMICTSCPASTSACERLLPMKPAPPVTTTFFFAILSSARRHENAHCLKHNKYVEQKRAVCKIVQVIRELHFGLDNISAVMRVTVVPHLRPARKPRRHKIAGVVVRNAGAVLSGERGQFRPRTDQGEVAAHNVP